MHDANAADARATGPSGPATDGRSVLPGVVSAEQRQNARDALLIEEKRATRALDALAAERRRLPVVEFRADYAFEGPESTASLLDLFDWYSCRDRSFNIDCGIGKSFGLSAFLRDGERVFRSRFTTGRGGPPALGPERARLHGLRSPGGLGGLAGRQAENPCALLVAAARRVRAAEEAGVKAPPPDVRALFDGADTAHVATRA